MPATMTKQVAKTLDQAEMTAALRANLAGDDRALAGIVPVVSHMLGNPGQALISDDVIARMRGIIAGIARQLCLSFVDEYGADAMSALEAALATNGSLTNHCYALAVEGALTQQLSDEHAIDPALPALLQELIASRDEKICKLAMSLMASQARFVEGQRRGISAPVLELPAELFDDVLGIWRAWALKCKVANIAQAETDIRAQYDEAATRLGMLNRLLSAIGASAEIVSEIETAGLAIFTSAIAKSTGQPRELVALSCQKQQCLRLTIALKSAGRSSEAILRQLSVLGADISLPLGFEEWGQDEALALLGSSSLGSLHGLSSVSENG